MVRTSHQAIIYVSVDSGSYDTTVFVWDIGGRKGTVYELHGHRQKVTFVRFLPSSKQLMTAGEDGNLVLWDMATTRIEVQTICVISNNSFIGLVIHSANIEIFQSIYNSFYRHAIGQNQTLVSCAVGHFFGTFERCMTKNKLDYGSIIAGMR